MAGKRPIATSTSADQAASGQKTPHSCRWTSRVVNEGFGSLWKRSMASKVWCLISAYEAMFPPANCRGRDGTASHRSIPLVSGGRRG